MVNTDVGAIQNKLRSETQMLVQFGINLGDFQRLPGTELIVHRNSEQLATSIETFTQFCDRIN